MADDPMWCVVMFDLPTKTAQQKREYTRFRHLLLDLGFLRTQYSVYSRYSPSGLISPRTIQIVKDSVPPQGEIRVLHVTDRQWASTLRFFNEMIEEPENEPEQLAFF